MAEKTEKSLELLRHVDLSRGLEKGWKSTEFFMTVLTFILCLLVQADVLGSGSQIEHVASLIIEGLASLGYGVSRTSAKNKINSRIGTLGEEVGKETYRAATESEKVIA